MPAISRLRSWVIGCLVAVVAVGLVLLIDGPAARAIGAALLILGPAAAAVLLWLVSRWREELGRQILEVERAQGRLQRILDTIAEGYYVLDREWRFLELNAAAERHFGPPAGVLGRSVWEVAAVAPDAPIRRRFLEAETSGRPVRFEAESLVRPGAWLELYVHPREDRFEVFFNDISDRKRAERERETAIERLRVSESRYRELVQNANSAIIRWRRDGSITFFNEFAESFFGYRAEEVIGRSVTMLLPERETSGQDLSRLTQTIIDHPERFRTFTNENVCRDGRRVYMAWTNRPLLDERGEVAEILAIGTDLTERQRARAELEESRRWLERIAETTPDIIFVLDIVRNRNVYSNRSLLEILGYSPEEFRRMDEILARAIVPEDLAAVEDFYRRMGDAAPGEVRSVAHGTRHKDGGIRWIEVRATPFAWDDDGRLVQVLGIATDATERRRTEEALRRAKQELEERVEERTVELRQRADQLSRLTSELTLAEQRERRRLAQVLHDHLQQILVGAKFGLQVLGRHVDERHEPQLRQIQDLLDESINASRSLTVELSPPILHEAGLAAGLGWLARWMRERHGLRVELELDSDAVTDREDMGVLLFQSVREALFNVAKHSGTDRARVETAVDDGGRCLRIVVGDRGRGIAPDALAARMGPGASGFGLFSIRERLDRLGGRMEIDSAPGRGFRLTLVAPRARARAAGADGDAVGAHPGPAAPAGAPPATPARPGPTAPARPARPRKLRVLLADDHAVMREGLRALLEEEVDLEVVGEAADGRAAVAAARERSPDVILMDVTMPEMDGLEATRAIHAELPRIRIIGLSMYDEADRAAAMLEAGAVAYASKSGKVNVLLDLIRGRASGADDDAGTAAAGAGATEPS